LKAESIGYLRCPACRSKLQLVVEERIGSELLAGQLLCEACQHGYEIKSGLPNLVYPEPEKLPEIDTKFLEQYERIAASYDRTMRLLSLLLGIWEPRARERDLIRPLDLEAGDRALEVSCGTGSNLPPIAERIGREGGLFALDMSPGMLAVGRAKLKKKGIDSEFVLGNAAYLPFEDALFDSVLHFGGINTFGEKQRAIAEMIRVAKPRAKIVIGDEGLAPGKERTRFGRWLLRKNRLFANRPPIELVPAGLEGLNLRWIWRGLFYLIEFEKAS